jgi:hypothetical protein
MFTKYSNKKTNGFASQLEFAVYSYLRQFEIGNLISNLQTQNTVHLTDAKIIYMVDFKFKNVETNKWEWAEAKGFETPVWRIKRRLWMHYGPGKLTIFKGSAANIKIHEEINPKNGL